jgi:hypothetical protein
MSVPALSRTRGSPCSVVFLLCALLGLLGRCFAWDAPLEARGAREGSPCGSTVEERRRMLGWRARAGSPCGSAEKERRREAEVRRKEGEQERPGGSEAGGV